MNESPPADEDGFQAAFYSLLDESAIHHKLRHWIVHFYRERESALRGPIPRSVPAHEFFKHHNKLYETRCDGLLTRSRHALHDAVDRLVDVLYTQAVTEGGATLGVVWEDEKDELTATTGMNGNRRDGNRGEAADAVAAAGPQPSTNSATPSTRKSQWAAGDAVSGFTAVNGTTRSSRGWPLERENSPVAAPPASGLRTRLPTNSSTKRRGSSQDSQEERPKRTRRTSYSRPVRCFSLPLTLLPPPLTVSPSLPISPSVCSLCARARVSSCWDFSTRLGPLFMADTAVTAPSRGDVANEPRALAAHPRRAWQPVAESVSNADAGRQEGRVRVSIPRRRAGPLLRAAV